MVWKLLQYRNAYSEVFDLCDEKLQTKVEVRASRLMEMGNLTGMPATRSLGQGLFELRAGTERLVRFLFFFHTNRRIIFVVASFKDQKTLPNSTIDKARKIMATLKSEPELMNDFTEIH